MDGDFFIGASLATVLTKLSVRYAAAAAAADSDGKKRQRFDAECMLVLASILHLGRSGLPAKPITEDDADRIALCIKASYIFFLWSSLVY